MKATDELRETERDQETPHAIEDVERTTLVRDERGDPPGGQRAQREQERLGGLPFQHVLRR